MFARVRVMIFYLRAILSFNSFSFYLRSWSNSLLIFEVSFYSMATLFYDYMRFCTSTSFFFSISPICVLFLRSLIVQMMGLRLSISDDFFLIFSSGFGSSRKKLLLSLCSNWLLDSSYLRRQFSSSSLSRSYYTFSQCSPTFYSFYHSSSYWRCNQSYLFCSSCQLALLFWAILCSQEVILCQSCLFLSCTYSQRALILLRLAVEPEQHSCSSSYLRFSAIISARMCSISYFRVRQCSSKVSTYAWYFPLRKLISSSKMRTCQLNMASRRYSCAS